MAHTEQFLRKLTPIQQSIAGTIYKMGNSSGRQWIDICLDVRGSEQDSFAAKLSVTGDQQKKTLMTVSPPLHALIKDLWTLRRELSGNDIFYGYKLTVTTSGECDVSFDYDPNCVNDQNFKADTAPEKSGLRGKFLGR